MLPISRSPSPKYEIHLDEDEHKPDFVYFQCHIQVLRLGSEINMSKIIMSLLHFVALKS